jgi:hypothetical protein
MRALDYSALCSDDGAAGGGEGTDLTLSDLPDDALRLILAHVQGTAAGKVKE